MKAAPYFYNTSWMLACFGEARAYRRASCRVRQTQSTLLRKIVTRNCNTWFGELHNFNRVHNVDDFRRTVPVSTYENYAEPVDRIARGELRVLTAEPVELLEPTSGTTSGQKLIPYTAAMRRSFQRAIRAWIWDLFSNRPEIRHGNAYWSITPLGNAGRSTQAGIPIGFDNDAAYLGSFEQRLLANTMVVPSEVAQCSSVWSAQYATLFFLLRSRRLSLISVWSPTFLMELLSSLEVNMDRLCDDIEKGSITTDHHSALPSYMTGSIAPHPERAEELRAILNNLEQRHLWAKKIWPQLSLVSCWADGPSYQYAASLSQLLSGIELQPKGLLATEAFVSIPLLSHPGAGLAVRSHFFEFLPVDEDTTVVGSKTLLADEVQFGKQYQVIVTTGGGFYRYQLMDQVAVVGFHGQTPLLRFVGKSDDTTDLVGEKLNAAHVQRTLDQAIERFGLSPTFIEMIAEGGDHPHYLLHLVDDALASDEKKQADLCLSIDQELRSNPGYRYARDLGQLGCLKLTTLTQKVADEFDADRTTRLLRSGIRHGNIKPSVLSTSDSSSPSRVTNH